jgi:hypothetical protein
VAARAAYAGWVDPTEAARGAQPVRVIGIGASAGGIDAVQQQPQIGIEIQYCGDAMLGHEASRCGPYAVRQHPDTSTGSALRTEP